MVEESKKLKDRKAKKLNGYKVKELENKVNIEL